MALGRSRHGTGPATSWHWAGHVMALGPHLQQPPLQQPRQELRGVAHERLAAAQDVLLQHPRAHACSACTTRSLTARAALAADAGTERGVLGVLRVWAVLAEGRAGAPRCPGATRGCGATRALCCTGTLQRLRWVHPHVAKIIGCSGGCADVAKQRLVAKVGCADVLQRLAATLVALRRALHRTGTPRSGCRATGTR